MVCQIKGRGDKKWSIWFGFHAGRRDAICGEKKNGSSSKVNKDKWFLFFSIRFVECLSCRYILSIVTKTMCNGEEQKKNHKFLHGQEIGFHGDTECRRRDDGKREDGAFLIFRVIYIL